jgi:eukaryotic-like serine/threonine-protein kinase
MPASPVAPPELADTLKQQWRAGSPPDLRAALRDHPTLVRYRSLVLDLAFEAYALREEAGPAPDPEAFCRDLPAYRSDVRALLRDYRALQDNPHVLNGFRFPGPGETFDRCEVVRELGHGAFARAYLATDRYTGGRRVVLKLSATASVEAELLGQLRHPHVAEVLWARPVEGGSAVCMLYGGAATLLDVIAAAFADPVEPPTARTVREAIDAAGAGLPPPNDPVPPPLLRPGGTYADAVARVAARLAGALAYVHGRGLTHGDLKPSNVVLAPGGHPYLIDFNLSGREGERNRYGGTLPYMAPERVRRLLAQDAAAGDGRAADVYAFGAVLHEALTGRVPFPPLEGAHLKVIAADLHRRQLAGAPRLRAVGVPRALARVVDACLAAEPARRPTAADLERRLGRFVRRRVRRARVAVALVLAGLAVLAGVQMGAGPPDTSRSDPPPETEPVPRPTTPDGLIARARQALAAGDRLAAEMALAEADRERPTGESAALRGLCSSKAGKWTWAVHWYEQAIARPEPQPAWVYNNLAFARLQSPGNAATPLWRAVDEASRALELEPGLRPAHYNRAWARFRAALDRRTRAITDPESVRALEIDIQSAMAERPVVPDLYYLAAQFYAASSVNQPARADLAIGYLRQGIAAGLAPTGLDGDLVFKAHLARHPEFPGLAKLARGPSTGSAADRCLIDPFAR